MGNSRAKRPPTEKPNPIGFDDGIDESGLLDMISGIESRLGDLRDATLAIPEHEEPPPTADRIVETVPGADHASSMARQSELDRRERDISEREQLLLAQTERIDHECGQLEQARVLLTEQQETYSQRAEAIKDARADIERRTHELEPSQAKIEAGEIQLAERAQALDLREAEVERLREALTEQQSQMEQDAEQYAQLQGEISSLFERLSEAEAHAIKGATSTEANPEIERRWRDLEGECTRLKRELSTTRKTLRETESRQNEPSTDPAPEAQKVSHRARASAILTAGWLVGGALLGLAILLVVVVGTPTVGVTLLGGVFAAYFVSASHVAKRLVTPSTIAFTLLAATFGLWIPIWTNGITEALALWEVPLSYVPPMLHTAAPLAIAILSSGLVMAWALYLVTSSASNFGAAFVASLVAATITLIPVGDAPLIIAAILWNAVVAASLSRWALNAIDDDSGLSALTLPSLGNVPRRPSV